MIYWSDQKDVRHIFSTPDDGDGEENSNIVHDLYKIDRWLEHA